MDLKNIPPITSVILRTMFRVLLFAFAAGSSVLLTALLAFSCISAPNSGMDFAEISIMDALDRFAENAMAEAEISARATPKHFWIDEDVVACPEPDQSAYGQSSDPKELQWLLDQASDLLDGQSTLFNTDIQIFEDSLINYYFDDSILAITWKQVYGNLVYTISEIKIADPSQFRRYIADGEFDSPQYYLTSEMSAMTNAVVASSADFYRYRNLGTIVYDRQVRRMYHPFLLDVCYVDSAGDLIFSYRGEINDMQTAQNFVDENDILFGLTFGPILVDNGERCEPHSYIIGEINDRYSRAALCQYDKLHYIVVSANAEGRYSTYQTIHELAGHIASMGVQKAYTLDGGRTATIVMNDQVINKVSYGDERSISDIIYFATAIPNQNNTGSRE